jgi:hypothetical protein
VLAGGRDGVSKTNLGFSRGHFGQRQQQLTFKSVQLGLDPSPPAPGDPIPSIGQEAEAGCGLPRPPLSLSVQRQEIR